MRKMLEYKRGAEAKCFGTFFRVLLVGEAGLTFNKAPHVSIKHPMFQ
jgi:hypothetical protein